MGSILVAVFLATFAASLGKEFGCDEGEVWGEPVSPKLFADVAEFNSFMGELNEIKDEIMANGPFDDMDTNSYQLSDYKNTPENKPIRNNLGLTMELFKKMEEREKRKQIQKMEEEKERRRDKGEEEQEEQMSSLADHYYFALSNVDQDLDEDVRTFLYAVHNSDNFYNSINIDRPYIVGIIKFEISSLSTNTRRNQKGFVLIDMHYNIVEAIKTYRTDTTPLGLYTKYFLEDKGQTSEIYISAMHFITDHFANAFSRDNIYANRPYCKFIETTNQMIGKIPVRSIVKFSSQSNNIEAFVVADLTTGPGGHSLSMGYMHHMPDGRAVLKMKSFKNLETLSQENQSSFLDEVCRKLTLEKAEVKRKITEMEIFKSENNIQRKVPMIPILRWIAKHELNRSQSALFNIQP